MMNDQVWIEDNIQELSEKFLKVKGLEDEFEIFCLEKYNEWEQDNADLLYEARKDEKAEQDFENDRDARYEKKEGDIKCMANVKNTDSV